MKFSEKRIKLPNHDADVVIVFPNGEELVIQARPSNADQHKDRVYPGSLDIILPGDTFVALFQGDDLAPAPRFSNREHERRAKQIVTELPSVYPTLAKKAQGD